MIAKLVAPVGETVYMIALRRARGVSTRIFGAALNRHVQPYGESSYRVEISCVANGYGLHAWTYYADSLMDARQYLRRVLDSREQRGYTVVKSQGNKKILRVKPLNKSVLRKKLQADYDRTITGLGESW